MDQPFMGQTLSSRDSNLHESWLLLAVSLNVIAEHADVPPAVAFAEASTGDDAHEGFNNCGSRARRNR
jgi:hypothetical protein